MTNDTIAKAMQLNDIGAFDYAYPIDWFLGTCDRAYEQIPYIDKDKMQRILRQIVWLYPREGQGSMMGFPCPLTKIAFYIYTRLGFEFPDSLRTEQMLAIREITDEVLNHK